MKPLKSLDLKQVHIEDCIVSPYIDLVRREIIPYQWKALNDQLKDTVPSFCIRNFRRAAGLEQGGFEGAVFQDSDVAKWLETVAYSLSVCPDAELESLADQTIDLIGRAQQPDGYLDTYFILNAPDRKWTNLKEGHELYVAGHMIEAAVAYTEATGKKHFLAIVTRLADLICNYFGPGKGQCHGYPGHEEIELALVRLYRITGERRYLDMAKYFIDTRGTGDNYFLREEQQPLFRPIWAAPGDYDPAYFQADVPVRQLKTMEGHAVRAMYLCCAMADLAAEYDDEELFRSCVRLWNDTTKRRMYLTGGIGSSGTGERFTADYDLPNDGNYSESCASIGLAQFGKRMAQITRDASYIDVVERALYNTVLAGIASDGKSFFYVNPMEVWPANCIPHTSRDHVKAVRQKWFGVACCPPNIARTLASFGQYVCFADEEQQRLYLNLYVGGEIHACFRDAELTAVLEGRFPEDGTFRIRIRQKGRENSGEPAGAELALRVPDYAEDFEIRRNGTPVKPEIEKGYVLIRSLEDGDELEIHAAVAARFVHANPQVRADEGKLALVKGPLVYCLEETDNFPNLNAVLVSQDTSITEEKDPAFFGGLPKLRFSAKALSQDGWNEGELYSTRRSVLQDVTLTAVPYFAWGNRKPGEMLVWMRERL